MTRPPETGPFAGLSGPHRQLAARLAITHLTNAGVSRARWLMSETEPDDAFESLRVGKLPVTEEPPTTISNQRKTVERWFSEAKTIEPEELLERHLSFPGLTVIDPNHRHWPFATDPEPPNLIFVLGDPSLLSPGHSVGVVGTRRCSTVGLKVADHMGADLSWAGVSVVSGLALGVDAAAHVGAAKGPTARIGVVASGLDVPYPKRNRRLWDDMAQRDVLISEGALGAKPERWRFPARNRLIASLSEAVVVVESHESGGSLLTVDEAAARDREVFAVPGSVLSSSCVGSNQLLMDGCAPVRSGQDIVDALGIGDPARRNSPEGNDTGHAQLSFSDAFEDRLKTQILAEVLNGPVHVDTLVGLTHHPLPEVLIAIQNLSAAGAVTFSGSRVDAV